MDFLLDLIKDSVANKNIAFAMIGAIYLLLNVKNILLFLDERKKVKISQLLDALQCEHIQGTTKSYLEEELANEHFKIVTGIYLEKEYREAILLAHKKAKGELAFRHFKRALPHLHYKDGVLSIKIDTFDNVTAIINVVFGMGLVVLGVFSIGQSVFHFTAKGFLVFMQYAGLGFFMWAMALFALYQMLPIISARKVRCVLITHANS